MQPKTVLFLCTGNYYRSRFAEILFNHLATQAGVPWLADSRALDLALGSGNIGPISAHTIDGLNQRQIALPAQVRCPIPVSEEALRAANLIIALKEAEHRRMLQLNFPQWVDRVEYWHVHDLDQSAPQQALAEIETLVGQLFARLQSRRDPPVPTPPSGPAANPGL